MSIEDVFTLRTVITFIAVFVVVFVAFALIRSVISGGRQVVWEILRASAWLICVLLVGLSGRGNIGPWGAWVGFGSGFATLLIALYVSRSAKKTGRGSSPNF